MGQAGDWQAFCYVLTTFAYAPKIDCVPDVLWPAEGPIMLGKPMLGLETKQSPELLCTSATTLLGSLPILLSIRARPINFWSHNRKVPCAG